MGKNCGFSNKSIFLIRVPIRLPMSVIDQFFMHDLFVANKQSKNSITIVQNIRNSICRFLLLSSNTGKIGISEHWSYGPKYKYVGSYDILSKGRFYRSNLAKPFYPKELHVSCPNFCLHKGSKNAPIISYASMSQNGIDVHLFMKKITYCNRVTKPEA